jgi:hypothetical protein
MDPSIDNLGTEIVYKGGDECDFECDCGYTHHSGKNKCSNCTSKSKHSTCKPKRTPRECEYTYVIEEKYTCPSQKSEKVCSDKLISSDFYNSLTAGAGGSVEIIISPGMAIPFPSDGPSNASASISRMTDSIFKLVKTGLYKISFNIIVNGPSQVIARVNGAELPMSVSGVPTAGPLSGLFEITVTVENSTLGLYNPTGNANLLLGGILGGAKPQTIHLIIDYLGSV